MRSTSNFVAAATLVSFVAAGNAPVCQVDPKNSVTYTATLPNTGVDAITGAVIGAASPAGTGTNFQVSFYNLPGSGSLSYGLYTGKVSNGDCSTAGAILDPYAGTTGSQCSNNPASCQVGDLSDKNGEAKIVSGGSGTGYFSANYVDKYVSTTPSNQAFFGNGSLVIHDSTGAAVACANFINQAKLSANSNHTKSDSTSSSASMPSSTAKSGSSGNGNSNSQSSSTSSGGAMRTAAPFVGAGVLGMAALLI